MFLFPPRVCTVTVILHEGQKSLLSHNPWPSQFSNSCPEEIAKPAVISYTPTKPRNCKRVAGGKNMETLLNRLKQKHLLYSYNLCKLLFFLLFMTGESESPQNNSTQICNNPEDTAGPDVSISAGNVIFSSFSSSNNMMLVYCRACANISTSL